MAQLGADPEGLDDLATRMASAASGIEGAMAISSVSARRQSLGGGVPAGVSAGARPSSLLRGGVADGDVADGDVSARGASAGRGRGSGMSGAAAASASITNPNSSKPAVQPIACGALSARVSRRIQATPSFNTATAALVCRLPRIPATFSWERTFACSG